MPAPNEPQPSPRFLFLPLMLVIVFAVAGIGTLVTTPKIPTWYAGLAKPWFNPPPWIFGPVWTVLYGMMAVAAWRVFESAASAREKRVALGLYAVQLALNAAWAPVFFGLQRPGAALIVVVALLIAVALTTWRFRAADRVAGLLFAPYLAWVAFATALNAAIVALN
jgi:tryptophan-rich sensory protein